MMRYLCVVFLMSVSVLMAQGAPEQIQDAIDALNTELGTNLSLGDLTNWTWEQITAEDTSLGCPTPGETYTPGSIVVYRFELTYNGQVYEYRVSADRTIVRSCDENATDTDEEVYSNPLCRVPPEGIAYIRTRLAIGIKARVIPNGFNNLRDNPTVTANQVGEIPAEGEFDVLNGPICDNDGYVWWQVSYNGLTAWTAEGKEPDYFVEPLSDITIPAESRVVLSPQNMTTLQSAGKLYGNFREKVAFSTDGRFIALGGVGGEGAWVYDNLNTAPRVLGVAVNARLTSIDFSSLPSSLALFGGISGGIRLWDLRPDAPVLERVFLFGHDDPVSAIAYEPNGTLLASSGGFALTLANSREQDTNAIILWDVQSVTQRGILRGHTDSVTGLAFFPNSPLLVSVSQDSTLRVWDTQNYAQINLATLTVPGSATPYRATSLELNAAGTLAYVGTDTGALLIVNLDTMTQITALTGHQGAIKDLELSPDGTLLATVGDDGRLIVWSTNQIIIATDATVAKFTAPEAHTNGADGVTFNREGTLIATVGEDFMVRLWASTNLNP